VKKNARKVEEEFSKVVQLFIGETICKERKDGGRAPYNLYRLSINLLSLGVRSVRSLDKFYGSA